MDTQNITDNGLSIGNYGNHTVYVLLELP